MTSSLWKTGDLDAKQINQFALDNAVPTKVAGLLLSRGIQSRGAVTDWLDASQAWSHPHDFRDMASAVDRLLHACSRREKIAVVGDYDVDGVTSSAILCTVLQTLGAPYVCLIPHRIRDGYGLSIPLVTQAFEEGATVLVTVDNGIRATDAVKHAVQLGLDVILTDHHEAGDPFPQGQLATIHYTLHQHQAEAKQLSGAGVAWKLSCALLAHFPDLPNLDEVQSWIHGLATLGALADVMPMQGENRRLVRSGLQALATCQRPGWLELCKLARVALGAVKEEDVLWRIAPRINAAGRVGDARVAFQLLMSVHPENARIYAEELEKLNDLRRLETDRATLEAKQLCELQPNAMRSAVVIAGAWNPGVVGIVAARLADEFGCPALVFADTGDEVLKGSGRGPKGFSLYQALTDCQDLLHHFGGHSAAVGCGVTRTQFEAFRAMFEEVAATSSGADERAEEGGSRESICDDYLPLTEATLELFDWLSKFSPYGPDNPPLTFFIGPVEILKISSMSGGKHARVRVTEGTEEMDMLWFSADEAVFDWRPGDTISALAVLEENVWQGVRKPQLRIQAAWRQTLGLPRSTFAMCYRKLREAGSLQLTEFEKGPFAALGIENANLVFTAFCELGFAEYREGAYHRNDSASFRDLRDSVSYQQHLRSVMMKERQS